MYELKKLARYLRVNLFGPGPRLMKKNLPGRGLTKVEKHLSRWPDIAVLKFIAGRTPKLAVGGSFFK